MLAKQLSHILTELCHGSDITANTPDDMDQRFESLRDCGCLPSGRENQTRALTNEEILTAVFGLVTVHPGRSGPIAKMIAKLKPVGGKTGALGGVATLSDALSHMLAEKSIRKTIIAVRLSVAEAGINSHGFAVITYDSDDVRCQLSFVRDQAVSLLQPGAAAKFDADLRYAPVSREIVFNRNFFDQLVRKIEKARAYPSPPIGDGSEYDKEDAERERWTRLGVTTASNFLNIGVDNQVTWPNKETLIEFNDYKFVLMPKTRDNVQSIHVDLHANQIDSEEAMTAINRFLSLLTWCDDQYAIAQDGGSGNPVPVAVPKRNLAFTTANCWVFDRDIPVSEEVLLALALYREARNAEQNFMITYAVLGYFKVLEIRYPERDHIKPWIKDTFPLIWSESDQDSKDRDDFLKVCGDDIDPAL